MLKKSLSNRKKTREKPFLVLGIVGKRASGKDFLTRYLVGEYQAEEIIFSRYIRQALKFFWLPEDRENLVWLISRVRRKFDRGILSNVAIETIKKQLAEGNQSFFILNGMRVWREIVLLKKEFGSNFALIYVDSPDEQRWQRIKKREENGKKKKDEIQNSLRDFINQENKILTEREVPLFKRKADFVIKNKTTQADFLKTAKNLVKRIVQKKGL